MIGLGLALVLPAPVLRAADAGLVQLSGHVPAVVAHLQAKGHFVATNIDLSIALPLRNKEQLTNLLQQINDPASPGYHQYLTPAQFAAQFGPTEQDYQAVTDFARQNGLKVTATHGNRVLLDVSGQSADIEKAFHVTLGTYAHPTEHRDFFAPDVEPSVPANLPILEVGGLNNYSRPYSNLKKKPVIATPSVSKPGSSGKVTSFNGTGPGGTYMGNDFRNAYIPGSTLLGAGQKIALVQFDGYLASDIAEYESVVGRTNIPLNNILIDGFNGLPTGNGGEVEVSLDIEMVVSMAPAIAQVNVYEGNPDNFHPNDVLNQIATDDTASQVSCSWGWTGLPTAATDQIFQQMALQGQTFYTASGDSDAYPVGSTIFTPSGSPYVTSVGGTTLTMTAGGASRVSETVWNWDVEYGPAADGIGTSGGVDFAYKIPYWQTNVNMTANGGSTTYRNFPDVAMTGDNVLVIADGGAEYDEGGTSCATPLWAGFTALINQQETNYSRAPIGFINPALYALGNSNSYAKVFNDITTGSNTWSGSTNLFIAVTNYDLCTGLGTPGGTNLINALVGSAPYVFKESAPQAPYGTTMSALSGGSPNGAWTLFVQDDVQINSGMISNGWMVTMTLGSPVGAYADLGLTMTPSTNTVYTNSDFAYYLTLTNYGGLSTATNVIVEDTLPTGVSLLSSNISSGGSIIRNGSLVTWSISNLLANAGASLALTVLAPATNGIIVDSAIAQSATTILNSSDNNAIVDVNVILLAPPVPPAPPQIGANFSRTSGAFTLNITGLTNSVIIYASTNLASTNWVPVYTNTAPFQFTDPNKTNFPYRFYRAGAVTGP